MTNVEDVLREQYLARAKETVEKVLAAKPTETMSDVTRYFTVEVDVEGHRVTELKAQRTVEPGEEEPSYSAWGWARPLKKDGTPDGRQSAHWKYLPDEVAKALLEGSS